MGKLSEKLKKAARPLCSAVVLAAGSSVRMGRDKLDIEISGVTVMEKTLRALDSCGCIDEIVVVTRADKLERVSNLVFSLGSGKISKVVSGGSTRTESALAGVSETNPKCGVILIHDGARPYVDEELVSAVVRAAQLYKSAAAAVPVKDTIRIVGNDSVTTPDRACVFAMQTPQGFDPDVIKGALTIAVSDSKVYTDDCAAVEALGLSPHLTPGSERNIKITTPQDIFLAEAIEEMLRDEQK